MDIFLACNVLNKVGNSNEDIDQNLIENTANCILGHPIYKKYTEKFKTSASDLKYYFKQLDLYSYLKRIRQCKRMNIIKFERNDIKKLNCLFEEETIEFVKPDYSWYDHQIVK